MYIERKTSPSGDIYVKLVFRKKDLTAVESTVFEKIVFAACDEENTSVSEKLLALYLLTQGIERTHVLNESQT